jgi:hypothetical protein
LDQSAVLFAVEHQPTLIDQVKAAIVSDPVATQIHNVPLLKLRAFHRGDVQACHSHDSNSSIRR